MVTSLRILLVAALALTASGAHAREISLCKLGAGTPSAQALRFDLPEGTDFFSIEPQSKRPTRFSDDNNWHLAQGLVVVNAETLEIAAARVEVFGTNPRRAVVSIDGTDVAREDVAAPDAPFYHQASRPALTLPAGSYYAVGFGSDGGDGLPNEWWAYDLRIGGHHACAAIGSATVFDIDHTEFSGGTQLYAPAAGVARDISHSYVEPAETDLVVGLMDAAVQGAGEAVLSYVTPLAAGEVDDTVIPFVSTAGSHSFGARFHGPFTQILIAGAALDLS